MPSNTPMALALARVSARFDDVRDTHHLALRNITLSIPQGAFVSIMGPSGAGKSTLLRVILGLMKPSAGEIVRTYTRPSMVFQNYALFPWCTALDNVAFPAKMHGASRSEARKLAREKLLEVGLEHFETHYPGELSGGQRQRVGLARALAQNPDFLILDEPFSNLDTLTAEKLKKDLLTIWRSYKLTILMVNHLIPDAIELSDEILLMSAHPGEIRKAVAVTLPRPRDIRSQQFFTHVDALAQELNSLT